MSRYNPPRTIGIAEKLEELTDRWWSNPEESSIRKSFWRFLFWQKGRIRAFGTFEERIEKPHENKRFLAAFQKSSLP